MNRVRFLLFLPVVALFCAVNLLAAQRTFVSAGNGNDANTCSRALPCRSFTAAIAQTDVDGEVIVLDSGGYGVVTITKSISLISPSGAYAGITAFSGDAVTVNAGTGRVVLRNLSLTSQVMTANAGIHATSVASLSVENCAVSGFDYGIRFEPPNTGAFLYVRDTNVSRSSTIGIYVTGGTGVQATIDSVRLQQNSTGIYVTSAEATIRGSVTSGVGNAGFWAATGSTVIIEESVATRHATGFEATGGGVMTVTRCAATSNYGAGAQAGDSGSTIYISDSTIASNVLGVYPFLNGVIYSRGNNTMQANMTKGSFTNTFLPD
jgi:hypothetical protein